MNGAPLTNYVSAILVREFFAAAGDGSPNIAHDAPRDRRHRAIVWIQSLAVAIRRGGPWLQSLTALLCLAVGFLTSANFWPYDPFGVDSAAQHLPTMPFFPAVICAVCSPVEARVGLWPLPP